MHRIINPLGASVSPEEIVPIASGIQNGYQTLDGIGGVLITIMLITAAYNYGYKEHEDVKKMIVGADLISAALLAIVYGGLTYLAPPHPVFRNMPDWTRPACW